MKDAAETLEALATVVALIIGGIWTYSLFIRNRLRYPRATTEHLVGDRVISENQRMLRVGLKLHNIGNTLLSIKTMQVRLRKIAPTDLIPPEDSNQPLRRDGRTFDWPELDYLVKEWDDGEVELEPGEKEEFCFDFMIPSDATIVEVLTYVKNAKKRKKEIGWSHVSLYTVK